VCAGVRPPAPPIHRLYRYRIDAPLDPNTQAPDHLPQDWEEP